MIKKKNISASSNEKEENEIENNINNKKIELLFGPDRNTRKSKSSNSNDSYKPY